ncbi:4690_t:CDS:1, partial [Ambispora leptoticha]
STAKRPHSSQSALLNLPTSNHQDQELKNPAISKESEDRNVQLPKL